MRTTSLDENLPEEQEVEPNSKPHIATRLVGGLIDVFLVFIFFFLANLAVQSTPLNQTYNKYRNEVILVQDKYKLETGYGTKVYDDDEKYNNYKSYVVHEADPEDEQQRKYVVVNIPNPSPEIKTKYETLLKESNEYNVASFNFKLVDYGFAMLSATISETILLLIIPLLNKRRATVGKLAAGETLINPKKECYARWYQVLFRYLFTLVIETALLALFLNSVIVMFVIVGLDLIVILFSRNTYRTIRDYLTRTMIIDKNTYLSLVDSMKKNDNNEEILKD